MNSGVERGLGWQVPVYILLAPSAIPKVMREQGDGTTPRNHRAGSLHCVRCWQQVQGPSVGEGELEEAMKEGRGEGAMEGTREGGRGERREGAA